MHVSNPDAWFIFNLQKWDLFLYWAHTYIMYYDIQGMQKYIVRNSPNLECWLFVHGSKSPSLLVPCAKPTAPF
jgi:hypothetical protein